MLEITNNLFNISHIVRIIDQTLSFWQDTCLDYVRKAYNNLFNNLHIARIKDQTWSPHTFFGNFDTFSTNVRNSQWLMKHLTHC